MSKTINCSGYRVKGKGDGTTQKGKAKEKGQIHEGDRLAGTPREAARATVRAQAGKTRTCHADIGQWELVGKRCRLQVGHQASSSRQNEVGPAQFSVR